MARILVIVSTVALPYSSPYFSLNCLFDGFPFTHGKYTISIQYGAHHGNRNSCRKIPINISHLFSQFSSRQRGKMNKFDEGGGE